jgi:hypothetical protein
MSYDLRLCLPQPGRSPEEIATSDEADFSISDPIPEAEERKQRVAAALMRSSPALTRFKFDFEELARIDQITVAEAKLKYRYIELDTPEGTGGIQIIIHDTEASVTVPYWHHGVSARRIFQEIWNYLRILEREGNYFTYDAQLEKVLNLNTDFDAVLKIYESVSSEVGTPEQLATRHWWQFWK